MSQNIRTDIRHIGITVKVGCSGIFCLIAGSDNRANRIKHRNQLDRVAEGDVAALVCQAPYAVEVISTAAVNHRSFVTVGHPHNARTIIRRVARHTSD